MAGIFSYGSTSMFLPEYYLGEIEEGTAPGGHDGATGLRSLPRIRTTATAALR